MLNRIRQYARRALGSSTFVLSTTCLLGIASYFFGQPTAIELHWFWMALLSLSIVALPVAQFVRASETRRRDDELQAVLDAVPHSLFFKDTNLRYRQTNAEFMRFLARDLKSALGQTDLELFGPEESRRFNAQDAELMRSGEARTFDDRLSLGGEPRVIQTRKSPVNDRHGKLRGVVGVSIDVTEQVQLQRQLETAHDRLSMALEAARMGTWECDLGTGEIDADRRAREVLGLRSDDDHLRSAFSRIHVDDEEEVRQRMEASRTQAEVMTYEFRVVEDSGAVRWIEGFSLPNLRRDSGEYLIGVSRDITRRRLDEIALTEAKRRTERVLAALEASQLDLELALSVGGLGVWQSVTRVPATLRSRPSEFLDTRLTADAKIREIIGVTGDADISYRGLLSLLHPDDRSRAVRTLGLALGERDSTYRDQFRICAHDGVERTVDVKGVVKSTAEPDDADGKVQVFFTGIVRDISKDEALRFDLLHKAEEARSAEEAKAQFLAMMSHEVRTPLNGVLGMVELVLDSPLTEAQRSMLQRSRESSIALLTIINDILDFSKIEARKLDIEDRPLSLASLVGDVCAFLAPEAARKAIELSHHVDPEIPQFVLGDSVRLRQVLTNLVGNAIKFTSKGSVDVSARPLADASLQLVVRDTGIGIEAEAAARLFEPFYQAEGSTLRFGGTGLGLTIVKQLVELMQGEVRCESAPGQGTTFTVTLPMRPWLTPNAALRAESLSGPTAVPAAARAQIGVGLKLLLAEDHEVNREVITLQLAKLGFECDLAGDGEEAWKMLMAPAAHYAMLLTDCRMPRLDGYDLAERLRAHEAAEGLPRLPIVALTANALEGEEERCRAAGMDVYLTKPLQLQDFQDALAGILEARDIPAPASAAPPQPAAPVAYPALALLCGGDLSQVARLVRVFVDVTEVDLKAMDAAAESEDHPELRQLVHRLSSACHQLDEHAAVDGLWAMERLIDEDAIGLEEAVAAGYPPLRAAVAAALARARDFVRLHARPQ